MQNLFILKSNPNIIIINSIYRFGSRSSLISSITSRIRYVLNHYWLGSKLLYQNYKSVQQIRKKDKNSLTRNENILLEQFRYDIRVGIPFVLLFSIPIIGYSAPLIALIAPKHLPSTLIMPKQKVKFLEDDANASQSIIESFIKFSKTQYSSEIIYGIIPSIQFIEEVSNSTDKYELIMSSIPFYSSLFSKYFPLSLFPREHLLIVHKSVLHSSFLSKYFLSNNRIESQLEYWEYLTSIDNKKIKNIDKLTTYELVLSLYNRGIYFHLNEMGNILQFNQTNILNRMNKKYKESNENIQIDENILNDWKELLYQWINIHQKLEKFNPISTNFILHITPLLTKK